MKGCIYEPITEFLQEFLVTREEIRRNDADAPASERDRRQEQPSAVVPVDSGWHESCLRRAVEHGLCALYQAVVPGQVLWDALAFSVRVTMVYEALLFLRA